MREAVRPGTGRGKSARRSRAGFRLTSTWLLFPAFALVALAVFSPALHGPFVSDDLHYVSNNPYVLDPSPGNVLDVLDPGGAAAAAVENWAPVHLLLHALDWRLFGSSVLGHHVVNVLLHALASALLAAFLARCALPPLAAVLGGAFFLLHPANVEAVAWISQLKSPAALVLALCALLLRARRPLLGALLFGLALLAKPTAVFALPLALLLDRAALSHGAEEAREARRRLAWLGLWAGLLAGFAVAELASFQQSNAGVRPLHPDLLVHLRTVATIAARYLVMAATSYGVSAFHEPPPAVSLLAPWFLASLPLLALLAWRTIGTLARCEQESAFWVSAAVSFAPISQIFPFLYPMADRYLYFILPGLIGGTLLAGRAGLGRIADPGVCRHARRAATLLAVTLLALFAARSFERARVWSAPALLLADAAIHYPDGVSASLGRARGAAQAGDAETATRWLRAAYQKGFNRFDQVADDPAFAAVRGDRRFVAVVREMAGAWIEWGRGLRQPSQLELHVVAQAHQARGERDEAVAILERALAVGGPIDAQVREELASLRGRGAGTRGGSGPP